MIEVKIVISLTPDEAFEIYDALKYTHKEPLRQLGLSIAKMIDGDELCFVKMED